MTDPTTPADPVPGDEPIDPDGLDIEVQSTEGVHELRFDAVPGGVLLVGAHGGVTSLCCCRMATLPVSTSLVGCPPSTR